MKYSNTILTEDNFDDEYEKLVAIVEPPYNSYEGFVSALDGEFTVQEHEKGFNEYLIQKVSPNRNNMQFHQHTVTLAYEFGNGFMVFNFTDIL